MRRALVALSGAVWALAWFVQVVQGGATLSDGVLPGWEALRVSFSPIWPGDFGGSRIEAWLCVGSGLTNLVFVVAFARWIRREAPRTTIWSWILFASAAIDTFWFFERGALPDLYVGYWLWLGSFVLLGLAAFPRGRAGAPPVSDRLALPRPGA